LSNNDENMSLGLGKVDVKILKEHVLRYFPKTFRPSLDGNILALSGKVVISHNPALGVPLETLGFFAFHYTACNIAVKFATPKFAICGIYLPPGTTAKELEVIAKEFGKEAKAYGVEIVGGHTGVYEGINIPLVSTTMFGIKKRESRVAKIGDRVLVVGEVGAEAYWLYSLAHGLDIKEDFWRKLTCLPIALKLANVKGVKVMHDVSEGGIKGSLLEIVKWLNVGLSIRSRDLPLFEGINELGVDPLIAPSYGVLVALVDSGSLEEVSQVLDHLGVPYSIVGKVIHEKRLLIDGKVVIRAVRSELDSLYGVISSSDPIISCLGRVFKELEEMPEFSKLVPQVGTNIVYAKEGAKSLSDVAGLSGRVVVSLGRPKVCGKVVYGGSKYLASFLLEVMKFDVSKRACVNIKADKNVMRVLKELKLSIRYVPPIRVEDVCPITMVVKCDKKVYDAYYYPGAHGIEPSIVILARNPSNLLDILKEVINRVN